MSDTKLRLPIGAIDHGLPAGFSGMVVNRADSDAIEVRVSYTYHAVQVVNIGNLRPGEALTDRMLTATRSCIENIRAGLLSEAKKK